LQEDRRRHWLRFICAPAGVALRGPVQVPDGLMRSQSSHLL
jgi:hypothetical protein